MRRPTARRTWFEVISAEDEAKASSFGASAAWAFSERDDPELMEAPGAPPARPYSNEGALMTSGMSNTSAASRAPKVATSATMTSGRLPPLAKC